MPPVIHSVRLLRCAAASVFLFASPLFASGNSAWFTRSWQTDDGLPDNYVAAVAQSNDGFLWVGTAAGLLRFDGIRFTKFDYDDGVASEDGVTAIQPRHGGGLWVVPRRGGLVQLDENLSRAPLADKDLSSRNPLGIVDDGQGSVWVAYPNSVCEIKNGTGTQFTTNSGVPAGGSFFGLAKDTAGNIWLAKGSRLLVLRGAQFSPFRIPIPSTNGTVVHLASSRSNGVWVATGTHLFKCVAEGTVQDCGAFEADNPRAETWALMEDHSGAVWIGTDGSGLFRRTDSGFEKIETSHPYILSLTEDREGDIWVGTAGGGLDRVTPSGVRLEGLDTGASRAAIQSICEDSSNVLWGATQNGLLVSRVNGKWSCPITNAASLGVVTCVAADRTGAIWIGTRDRKFHRWYENELTTWGAREGFAGHTVVGLLPAANGDLWIVEIGNPNAVQCLGAAGGSLRSFRIPRNSGRLCAMAEDAAGGIWIASSAGFLFQVEKDEVADKSSLLSPSHQTILCLYPTSDGALWIGFNQGGIGRLKDGHFSRAGTAQGLLDDYNSQIVDDDQGWFWIGGGRGIFKVQRTELESVIEGRSDHLVPVRYGRNEGLFSVEANSVAVAPYVLPTAFRARDGNLWMPLRKEIAEVNPKILTKKSSPPTVLATRVALDNRTIADYGAVVQPQARANLKTLQDPLRLPPGRRKLDFEFTAFNFSAPENLRFRYRLEGLDDDWLVPETRSVSYSGVGAGDYHFRVQAANGNGPWNEAESAVRIIVPPFFWQTWWFRASLLALFTLGVIATVRYVSFRRLRRRLQLIEQQAALDKERSRIARDLHDDLGCSLTKMSLTLDMTHRETASVDEANGKLQDCSVMVRQIAKSVDEIVWAINPRNDTLRYLIDYISQFTVEFLHAAEIKCRVDLPENVSDVAVTPEVRHNLFMVLKEALNNVTRHARAGEARLTIVVTQTEVVASLEDNGCGFNGEPDNASADGLRNMRQRMAEVGGRFELHSKPGSGTRVAFFCPLRNPQVN